LANWCRWTVPITIGSKDGVIGAVLMVLIDDATSEVFAWFSEGETTIAAMEAFSGYVKHYGLPRALYVDRDSIYRCEREATIAENLAGKEPTMQFGPCRWKNST